MPTIVQSTKTGDAGRRPTREQCIADAARVYSDAMAREGLRRVIENPRTQIDLGDAMELLHRSVWKTSDERAA